MGASLNVGARSVMKITRHDPQSQQTEVELTVGRLRGEIVKFTKPGASFRVTTQTAVIGVVGAIVLIVATPKHTRVYCIEGVITVQNIITTIFGVTTLHAGEFATIPRGLPPTGAFHFTPGQLQAQLNQTNLGGVAGRGVNVAGTVVNTSRIVVSTTTAVVSGATITALDAAQSSSDAASGSARNATGSSNSATGDSSDTNTVIQETISASQPCGCE